MDVLLIVDMQVGVSAGPPVYDLEGVVARTARLAERVRTTGGRVLFVQHTAPAGQPFARGAPDWVLLPELASEGADTVVSKTTNDAFQGTELQHELEMCQASRILVCGWATDLCVDSTVRSAVARGWPVVVVRDCHTVADRPHLAAEAVIEHHHWLWTQLLGDHPVQIQSASELLAVVQEGRPR